MFRKQFKIVAIRELKRESRILYEIVILMNFDVKKTIEVTNSSLPNFKKKTSGSSFLIELDKIFSRV